MAHATALRAPAAEPWPDAPRPLRLVPPPLAERRCATPGDGGGLAFAPTAVLARLAARAASNAAGVASLAPVPQARLGAARVVVALADDGERFDLRMFVRAYLGDFHEMGMAVRHAVRAAAKEAGVGHLIGLIDVQVVELVMTTPVRKGR